MGLNMGTVMAMSNPMVAVGTAGAGAADTWYTNREATQRAHEAQDFSAASYAQRYQVQTKDMMKAGLNPMLAYQQSPGASPQGITPQVQKMDLAKNFNEARLVSAQEANLYAGASKQESEKKNIDAKTLTEAGMPAYYASLAVQATSSAAQADENVKMIRAQIPKVEAEVKRIEQEIKKSKSDVKLNESLIHANEVLNGLRMAETYLTSERSRIALFEGDVLQPKARAAKLNTAFGGHIAENVGKFGSAAWKFAFPTFGGN